MWEQAIYSSVMDCLEKSFKIKCMCPGHSETGHVIRHRQRGDKETCCHGCPSTASREITSVQLMPNGEWWKNVIMMGCNWICSLLHACKGVQQCPCSAEWCSEEIRYYCTPAKHRLIDWSVSSSIQLICVILLCCVECWWKDVGLQWHFTSYKYINIAIVSD